MPAFRAELSRARAVAGDWDEKKKGLEEALLGIGKEQVEKGLHLCFCEVTWGEKTREM